MKRTLRTLIIDVRDVRCYTTFVALSKILNATEARKNFYQLLKQVSSGAEILIENTDTGEKFQIIKSDPKPKTDKLALLDTLLKSIPKGLPDHSPEEIKQILHTTHDIKLP